VRGNVYNQFLIRVPGRNALRERLAAAGVATEIYYPLPLHLQECFRHLGYREGDLPRAERASRDSLALPLYPELTRRQIAYVVKSLEGALLQAPPEAASAHAHLSAPEQTSPPLP
jgi:dTDP-4-amino-4,6-dideoxygalactose transaminase